MFVDNDGKYCVGGVLGRCGGLCVKGEGIGLFHIGCGRGIVLINKNLPKSISMRLVGRIPPRHKSVQLGPKWRIS